ncbi:MAG: fasciclin domain-containing protein [Dysgonamonadaceae bacterium]|jgi:uncharacterized surface protein with fasciclin (FAS1) repeats|nr:fasciclin domain-containing protein [Dysgonamonadaceae bacterium]
MSKTFIKTLIRKASALFAAACLSALAVLVSCEKALEGETYRVYDDKMLDELLDEYQLTAFKSVVEKAEMTGTIHAYGAYTLFVPTDEAVNAYLQSLGKSGAEALTKDEAAAIVKYHLVRDTLKTTDFVDGRLATQNFSKKYLTTKYDGGRQTVVINREAGIVEKDIRAANGIMHIIDKTLSPPKTSVTDVVRALPDDYSLFKSFFELSGWAGPLDVEEEDVWFTLFIQDNTAYAESGINNLDDLLAQLREYSPAIENVDTLMYNYIGYHVINRLLYCTDLMSLSSMQSAIPKQIITFKRNQDVILLNELNLGQTTEAGIPVDRESDYSDLSCSNGVTQKINGNIQIKNRSAYRIYWDVTEQPEIMALLNFRKKNANVNFNPGELSEVTWGGKAPGVMNYYCAGYSTVLDEKFQYVYGDYLRFILSTTTTSWVEFKTPVLVEGKYKVWLCYRREWDCTLKTTFKQEGEDDQVLPYICSPADYMPNPEAEGSSHELIELDGWKQYNAKKYNSVVCSKLVGIIDVKTTDRHTLRFDVVSSSHSYSGNLDIIQFIPTDEDQLWPRMDILGNWIGPEVRTCEIWPYDDCGDGTDE